VCVCVCVCCGRRRPSRVASFRFGRVRVGEKIFGAGVVSQGVPPVWSAANISVGQKIATSISVQVFRVGCARAVAAGREVSPPVGLLLPRGLLR
jgi:hypothetical protein